METMAAFGAAAQRPQFVLPSCATGGKREQQKEKDIVTTEETGKPT
jgi:hypothetical protein